MGPYTRLTRLLTRGALIVCLALSLAACGSDDAAPTADNPDTGPAVQRSPAVEESMPDD